MEIKIAELKEALALSEKFKSCYFWNSPTSASSRRWMEENNTIEINGEFEGNKIEIKLECSCSCKNVYFERKWIVNGKSTNATKIKNLVKKAEEKEVATV